MWYSSLLLTACHTSASTLLVVSSRMMTCGSRTRARIRATLCRSPLDRVKPPPSTAAQEKYHSHCHWNTAPSVISDSARRWSVWLKPQIINSSHMKRIRVCVFVPVSYWSFSSEKKASALAFFAASLTFSSVQPFSPYSMLYLSEPENSSRSWDTKVSLEEMKTKAWISKTRSWGDRCIQGWGHQN